MELELDPTPTPTTRIPPLNPGIQTSILSHLLPPQLPLPQHLLSKSLLQRHLYLPPSPDDPDAFLSPIPQAGISDRLERLVATGWRVLEVRYANDGESILSRMKVGEDGREPEADGGGEGEGVDVVFEWEAGADGRGWTYLSCGDSGLGNLEWTSDPSQIPTPTNHEANPPMSISGEHHPNTNGNGNGNSNSHGNGNGQAYGEASGNGEASMGTGMEEGDGGEAPAGYWTGFSPPASPSLGSGTDPENAGLGEDDYWASYGKIYTPGGTPSATPGGVTPAVQSTPGPSRRNSNSGTNFNQQALSSHLTKNDPDPDPASTHSEAQSQSQFQFQSQSQWQSQSQSSSTGTLTTKTGGEDTGSGLLRSRLLMKIASLLRRIWTSYLPESDMEYRALTFLSLARQVQGKSSSPGTSKSNGNGIGFGGDDTETEGLKDRLEMLYEMYEVIDPKSEDGEGFYRLVEGCLATKPGQGQGEGEGGFGIGNRQDSSAQLNYWE